MMYKYIIVKFGEIFLKKKNRFFFIKKLFDNIKKSLEKMDVNIEIFRDYIRIFLISNRNINEIISILKDISGVHSFSPVLQSEITIDDIFEKSLILINKKKDGKTFKIFCKKKNKKICLKSDEIIRLVADKILLNTSLKVDVHNPDIKIFIEIHEKMAYVYTDVFNAQDGLPVGVSGNILMLISGGIDSPVAAHMLLNRGVMLDFIHFASPPYTSEAVIDKIKDIIVNLTNKTHYKAKLYIIPFTNIQLAIYNLKNDSYAITILRRMMYRIANRIAIKFNYLAIASGDSIGQVSSQTLCSMKTIENIKEDKVPLMRPLCAFKKDDIIKKAREIGTFDISIRPYEDCCTVFTTKKVQTYPDIDEVILLEKNIDFSLLEEAIKNMKTIIIGE